MCHEMTLVVACRVKLKDQILLAPSNTQNSSNNVYQQSNEKFIQSRANGQKSSNRRSSLTTDQHPTYWSRICGRAPAIVRIPLLTKYGGKCTSMDIKIEYIDSASVWPLICILFNAVLICRSKNELQHHFADIQEVQQLRDTQLV